MKIIDLMLSLALIGCSSDRDKTALVGRASDEECDIGFLELNIAYQPIEGGIRDTMVFYDERVPLLWEQFRDDRPPGSVQMGGPTEVTPCDTGEFRCLRIEGWPPLLSALPPANFLGGSIHYTSKPVVKWGMECTEISAVQHHRTTVSVMCPGGIAAYTLNDNEGGTRRFELRSWRGLFAEASPPPPPECLPTTQGAVRAN